MPNRMIPLRPIGRITGVIPGTERPRFEASQANRTVMFQREVEELAREALERRRQDLACMSLSQVEDPREKVHHDLEAMSLSRIRHGRDD